MVRLGLGALVLAMRRGRQRHPSSNPAEHPGISRTGTCASADSTEPCRSFRSLGHLRVVAGGDGQPAFNLAAARPGPAGRRPVGSGWWPGADPALADQLLHLGLELRHLLGHVLALVVALPSSSSLLSFLSWSLGSPGGRRPAGQAGNPRARLDRLLRKRLPDGRRYMGPKTPAGRNGRVRHPRRPSPSEKVTGASRWRAATRRHPPAAAEQPGPPGFTCPPRGVLAIVGSDDQRLSTAGTPVSVWLGQPLRLGLPPRMIDSKRSEP